jgi:hypothetical protein
MGKLDILGIRLHKQFQQKLHEPFHKGPFIYYVITCRGGEAQWFQMSKTRQK